MKKTLLAMAVAMMSLVFVSCEKEDPKTPTPPAPETSQLQKPSVSASVEGTTVTVSWNSIENAVSYTYLFESVEETLEDLQVVFEDITPGSYEFKVKANGNQTEYTDSEWASTTFNVEEQGGVGTGLTFEFEVADLTATSATVYAYPSDETLPYYFDVATLEEVEMMGGEEAYMEFIVELLIELGVEEGLSVEETLEILLSVGVDSWTPSAMVPSSDYIVYAFGVDYDGTINTEFFYEEFTTLASEGTDPAIEQYLGTWNATFSDAIVWGLDSSEQYYEASFQDGPISRTLTIEPYEGSDATGREVLIYGISALGDSYPALAQLNDYDELEIMAGVSIGEDQGGLFLTWTPMCIDMSDELIPVTGRFPAYAIYSEGDAFLGTGLSVSLTDGSEVLVWSLDIYGLTSGGTFQGLYTLDPIAAGDFYMVSASASARRASSVINSTKVLKSFSNFTMPSFSVVR